MDSVGCSCLCTTWVLIGFAYGWECFYLKPQDGWLRATSRTRWCCFGTAAVTVHVLVSLASESLGPVVYHSSNDDSFLELPCFLMPEWATPSSWSARIFMSRSIEQPQLGHRGPHFWSLLTHCSMEITRSSMTSLPSTNSTIVVVLLQLALHETWKGTKN